MYKIGIKLLDSALNVYDIKRHIDFKVKVDLILSYKTFHCVNDIDANNFFKLFHWKPSVVLKELFSLKSRINKKKFLYNNN